MICKTYSGARVGREAVVWRLGPGAKRPGRLGAGGEAARGAWDRGPERLAAGGALGGAEQFSKSEMLEGAERLNILNA